MKHLIIFILLIFILFSFSWNNKKVIKGSWIICGDKIDPSNLDSIRLIKQKANFNFNQCDDSGICKYSEWEFLRNNKISLSHYTGCPNMPIRMASSNLKWTKWFLNKNSTELIICSDDKKKIKFKIIDFNDSELILLKSPL